MPRHFAVTATITFSMFGPEPPAVPVTAELGYCTIEPFAITIRFASNPREVEWIFCRDLLSTGLLMRCGEGDVRVSPVPHAPDLLALELVTPDGEALLVGRAPEVDDFLAHTYDIVPSGDEARWIDFEQELEALLSATDR